MADPMSKVAESPKIHLRFTYKSPKNHLRFTADFGCKVGIESKRAFRGY